MNEGGSIYRIKFNDDDTAFAYYLGVCLGEHQRDGLAQQKTQAKIRALMTAYKPSDLLLQQIDYQLPAWVKEVVNA